MLRPFSSPRLEAGSFPTARCYLAWRWPRSRRRGCSSPDLRTTHPPGDFWLVVGVGLGLAGLSKYSAVLTAGGLAAFVLISPDQRHWLKHPAPYVAAIVALAMITPVIVWNAQHGWASFEFQGARGVPAGGLRPAQFATMVLGQIAFLSPCDFCAAGWRPGERVPSTGGRAARVSALPKPAADRSLHPHPLRAGADNRIGRCRAGSSPSR